MRVASRTLMRVARRTLMRVASTTSNGTESRIPHPGLLIMKRMLSSGMQEVMNHKMETKDHDSEEMLMMGNYHDYFSKENNGSHTD